MRLMITLRDPAGVPRAYAVGQEAHAALLWHSVMCELRAYIQERRSTGDEIGPGDFRPDVKILPDLPVVP